VFRPGKTISGVEHLRAIPWVFAWVQSRYVLPGWYGLGTGLEWFSEAEPDGLALLQQMNREWPFFRTVVRNAELELLRAHLPTARWYAARVPGEPGARIHRHIEEEYQRTRACVLRITGASELLDRAPVVRDTVALRNPLTAPLNKLQVYLLDQWDALEQEGVPPDDPRGAPWREALLLSIIGIAAAMQSTG
jgi:phosphoenolpyruvate carboxylase